MGMPRYTNPNEVISWLTNKVTFDLVAALPQPSSVVDNLDGTFNLMFTPMPSNYGELYNGANGSDVMQGDVIGDYLGVTDVGYGIVVGNVLGGAFTDSDGTLALSGNPNSITVALLYSLISKAESQVENDFYPLYMIPFQGIDGAAYNDLPETTLEYLNNMFVLKSCIKILTVGFAKTDGVRGETYLDNFKKEYAEQKNIIFTRARTGNLLSQPLPNLLMNTGNIQFDRMPKPIISNDDLSAVTYAKLRQTNPAKTPWFYSAYPYRPRNRIPWMP